MKDNDTIFNEDLIEMIKKDGLASKGKKYLIMHLEDEKLTRSQAVFAKCYDCMGYYADGREDCKIPNCPLFPWRPFKDRATLKHAKKSARSAVGGQNED